LRRESNGVLDLNVGWTMPPGRPALRRITLLTV
jgi:hypothetical protein